MVPSFYIGATFAASPGHAGPARRICRCHRSGLRVLRSHKRLIPSILLGFELFGGQGLELIALGCGVCYMLSGHHGLYSSQTFVTNKLRPEYAPTSGGSS